MTRIRIKPEAIAERNRELAAQGRPLLREPDQEEIGSIIVRRRHAADVEREQREWQRRYNARNRKMTITKSLPFFRSGCGTYIHRVRSGHVAFTDGLAMYSAFKMWCGQTGSIRVNDPARWHQRKKSRLSGELLAEPPAGYHLCATCEGRAIGAGMDGEREIRGRKVVFNPKV